MKNADPFGAKLISKKKPSLSVINANAAIMNGECVYVRDVPGKVVPDWVPSFDLLPEDIRNGFKRTFNYTALTALSNIKKRTSAEDWNRMLLKLAQAEPNPYLRTCSKNARHIYPVHNATCPWCGTQITVHDNEIFKKIRSWIGY